MNKTERSNGYHSIIFGVDVYDWLGAHRNKETIQVSSHGLDRKRNTVVVMSSRKAVRRLMVTTIPDVHDVTMK